MECAMKFKISTCYLYLLHVLDYVRFRSGVDVNVSVIGYTIDVIFPPENYIEC
jgi:hypothetical protein